MILFNQVRHHTHNYDAQNFQIVRKVLYSYFVYRLTGSTHVVSSGAKFFLSSFFFKFSWCRQQVLRIIKIIAAMLEEVPFLNLTNANRPLGSLCTKLS